MEGIIAISHSARFISEPPGVLFQNADSQVVSHPEIFTAVGLKWGPEMCYFIKLHGDADVPSQVKMSDLDQTHRRES